MFWGLGIGMTAALVVFLAEGSPLSTGRRVGDSGLFQGIRLLAVVVKSWTLATDVMTHLTVRMKRRGATVAPFVSPDEIEREPNEPVSGDIV